MSSTGEGGDRDHGRPRRSYEFLTVDELINRLASKARSRRGRLVLMALALVVAVIIVVIPLTRSAPANSLAATGPITPDPASVPSTAPAQTTLPTLPLGLFDAHAPTPLSDLNTSTSTTSTTTSTVSTTTVPGTTLPSATAPPTAPPPTAPPGPPDTGVQVPVG